MSSNATLSNPDADVIVITDRNGQKYATDHTTGDGCYGTTRAEALVNLAAKLRRKTQRNPANPEDVENLLNTK